MTEIVAPARTSTPPEDAIFQFLANSGARDLNIDAPTAINFDFVAPARCVLHRLNFSHVDNLKWNDIGFFSIPPLGVGCLVQMVDTDGTTVLQHFGTDVAPILRHADFYSLAGVDVSNDTAGNQSSSGIRWTMRGMGLPIELNEGQIFRIVIRDDLTSVIQLRGMVQGYFR